MIGLAAFSGCSKSSSGSSYTMSAKVGTTTFSGNTCQAILSGTALSITGFNGASATTPPYLSITITNFTGAGTFSIDTTALSPAVSCSYWPDATLTNIKTAHKGSVTITASSSSSVSGNFSFTATDGTTISSTSNFTAKRY